MSVYFTALEKIILLRAEDDDLIKFPQRAGEGEVWLGVLLHLEYRGYVKRMKGQVPMLPFYLTPVGRSLRHALSNASHHERGHMHIPNGIFKR